MNIWALIGGIAILAALATSGVVASARTIGWRDTLCALAFSLSGTALIVCSAFLISYGVGGFE